MTPKSKQTQFELQLFIYTHTIEREYQLWGCAINEFKALNLITTHFLCTLVAVMKANQQRRTV